MSIIKYYFVLTNLEHSLHIPFITKLILSNKNLSGNWIGGMAILSRQKVFLHRLQLKCTCKSPTVHIQLSLQIEYFIAPEPSSIVWMSRLSWKRVNVLNMVDLLTVSSSVSKSVRLKAFLKSDILLKINSLTEVGFMFLRNSFSSKSFILSLSVLEPYLKSNVKL